MSSKRATSRPKTAKNASNKNAPTVKGDGKKATKRANDQPKGTELKTVKPDGRNVDMKTITEESAGDVESNQQNTDRGTESKINEKPKKVANKRNKQTKKQILESQTMSVNEPEEATKEVATSENGSDLEKPLKKRAKPNKNQKHASVERDDREKSEIEKIPKVVLLNEKPQKKAKGKEASDTDSVQDVELALTNEQSQRKGKAKPNKKTATPDTNSEEDTEVSLANKKPQRKAKAYKTTPTPETGSEQDFEMISATEKSKGKGKAKANKKTPTPETGSEQDFEMVSANEKSQGKGKAKANKKTATPDPGFEEDTEVALANKKPQRKAKANKTTPTPDTGSKQEVEMAPANDNKSNKNTKSNNKSPVSDGHVSSDGEKKPEVEVDQEMGLPKDKPKQTKSMKKLENTDPDSVTISAKGKSKKAKANKKAELPETSKSNASSKVKEKAAKPANRSILQLKIVLREITPLIWRRIQVLNNESFSNLSNYIVEAMGWMGSHSHHFIAQDPKKKTSNVMIVNGSLDGIYDFSDRSLLNEQTTKLSKFLNAKDDCLLFEYDLGDSWIHEVVVEKVLPPPPPKAEYPKCTGGKRACPPEDCGGSSGYDHLLEVYKDPNHSEYQELIVDWLGDLAPGWEPETFNKKKIFKRAKMWVYVGLP